MIALLEPRMMIVDPFLHGGIRSDGIEIQHHDALPKCWATVLATHETRTVRPGDTIIFEPYAYSSATDGEGVEWAFLAERNVKAIVRGYRRDGYGYAP